MTKDKAPPFVAKEAEAEKPNPNMALWEAVCKTDPNHTKKFTKGGGFSGTAIKPYWLMRKATETFGVCGIKWGWEEFENKLVAGVWCSKVRLWFDYNGQKGAIEQWGQTVMEGKNKNGAFVDEEAPKKAITDAVTKCLSYLGFAGDVHMGLFDDSKYVEERLAEEAKPVFSNAALRKAWCENTNKSLHACETMAELMVLSDLIKPKMDELKLSHNEHDGLAYESVKQQFILAKTNIERGVQENAVRAGMPEDFNKINGESYAN